MKNIFDAIAAAISPPAPNTLQVLADKFAAASGKPLVSSADLKKIKAFENEWRDAWRDRNERYTSVAAKNEFQRQLTSENPPKPEGFATILSEFETRSIRAETKMNRVNADALPLVKTALENFVAAGEVWIDARIKDEKSEAMEFGVAFSPSQILLTAQRLIASHKIRIQNLTPSAGNPSGSLGFLKFD